MKKNRKIRRRVARRLLYGYLGPAIVEVRFGSIERAVAILEKLRDAMADEAGLPPVPIDGPWQAEQLLEELRR